MPSIRRRGAELAALGLTLCLHAALSAGCSRSARDPGDRPNLLFVLVDTLRADHVGALGSKRATTPHIDALAREATLFTHAYTVAPWTLPATATLLTGLFPTTHTANAARSRIPEEAVTLAEMLKSAGYQTAGVVSHLFLKPSFGMAQGFDTYDHSQALGHDAVTTPAVTDKAIARLQEMAARPAPFFLFVHYFDPHYNYQHHPEFGFAVPPAGGFAPASSDAERGAQPLTEQEADFQRALYDEEVAFTDGGIGRLIDALRATGRDDRTVIVLVADHGEEFLDHGGMGHTRSLYDELLRVPLLVRPSSASPGARRIDAPVTLVSVVPTVLELLGIDPSGAGFEAPSLAASVTSGERPAPQRIYAEVDYQPTPTTYKKSVLDGRWKLVRDDRDGRCELFDLEVDPGERHDLAALRPEIVRTLAQAIEEHSSETKRHALGSEDSVLTEQQEQLLHSLGYAGRSDDAGR